MVNRLMSTEYLNYEDSKFSKSRGIGVFGNDAQDTGIPADVWRFYLMYIRPENQDSAFKWEDLMTKVNSELLANLGNFVNRATKFTKDNFGSRVPEMELNSEDWEMVARVNQELANYICQLEDAREREGITSVFNISRLGNQLMQHNTPWKLVKGGTTERARAGTVVGLSVNLACLLCVLIQPYMPAMAARLERQLAVPAGRLARLPRLFHCFLPAGHQIGEPSPLVEEIKPALVEQLKARYQGKQSERKEPPPDKVPGPGQGAAAAADPAAAVQLEAEVTAQGLKVRELKAAKAEKAAVDAEVKVLLELKQRLAAAQGGAGDSKAGKKGKKK
jgi:methionyl-tRNA synthetase